MPCLGIWPKWIIWLLWKRPFTQHLFSLERKEKLLGTRQEKISSKNSCLYFPPRPICPFAQECLILFHVRKRAFFSLSDNCFFFDGARNKFYGGGLNERNIGLTTFRREKYKQETKTVFGESIAFFLHFP